MLDDDYVPELLHRLYEQTENPLFVWSGYNWYSVKQQDRPLPPWIREYFDGVYRAIHELAELSLDNIEFDGEIIRTKMVDALGLKRSGRGVRVDAYKARRFEMRDWSLATAVMEAKLKTPTLSFENIYADVAEANGHGADVVERAWAEWRHFVDGERSK